MPTSSLSIIPMLSDVSLSGLLWWVLLVMTLLFVGHTLVASYHWLTYGSERLISLLSIAIYAGGGACILLAMLITLVLM